MPSIFFDRKAGSKDFFKIFDHNLLEKCQFFECVGMTFLSFYPRAYRWGDGGQGGRVDATPPKDFSEFSLKGQNFSM